MSASKHLFELTAQRVITCTATVSDILLKKMCMFSLSQLGMLLMHRKLWSLILPCFFSATLITQPADLLFPFHSIQQNVPVTALCKVLCRHRNEQTIKEGHKRPCLSYLITLAPWTMPGTEEELRDCLLRGPRR